MSFPRYLASKKTIDDRALNAHVWATLAQNLPAGPVCVLEVGAGIGTMIERVLERGLLTDAEYIAVDERAENIAEARERLPQWASAHGWECAAEAGVCHLSRLQQRAAVKFAAADLFHFIAAHPSESDLLIAHAVLDLLDVRAALPMLLSALRPGGLFYFTLNFDGATIFEPTLDAALDKQIEMLYHRTMDERVTAGAPSGDSRAGRHLFAELRRAGAEALDMGSSDWVVFPRAGRYPADEAYFLRFIVDTVEGALRGHAELDAAQFAAWVAERRAQIERGELVYIAHQLDVVGWASAHTANNGLPFHRRRLDELAGGSSHGAGESGGVGMRGQQFGGGQRRAEGHAHGDVLIERKHHLQHRAETLAVFGQTAQARKQMILRGR